MYRNRISGLFGHLKRSAFYIVLHGNYPHHYAREITAITTREGEGLIFRSLVCDPKDGVFRRFPQAKEGCSSMVGNSPRMRIPGVHNQHLQIEGASLANRKGRFGTRRYETEHSGTRAIRDIMVQFGTGKRRIAAQYGAEADHNGPPRGAWGCPFCGERPLKTSKA